MIENIIYYVENENLKGEGLNNIIKDFITRRLRYFLDKDIILTDFVNCKDFRNSKNFDDLIILIDLSCPMLDEKLLHDMIDLSKRCHKKVISDGAVPGTSVSFVSTFESLNDRKSISKIKYWNRQSNYNSQLNLGRMKRARMFQKFLNSFPDLYKWPIKTFLDYCGSEEGVEFILSYTSEKKMIFFSDCPYCKSENNIVLHSNDGTTATGFLTKKSKYYYLCENCDLVYLNPVLPEEELHVYYDDFSYDFIRNEAELNHHYKNLNRNNVSAFYNYESIKQNLKSLKNNSEILDLGGGIGEFCVFAKNINSSFSIELYDYRIEPIVRKVLYEHEVSSKSVNFLKEDLHENKYDLISSWEVIEHIPVTILENFIEKISLALKTGGLYCMSTPDFYNPYTAALDFWSCFPGEHLSVLSRRFLEPIFNKYGLYVIKEGHECVTMDLPNTWYKYGSDSNISRGSRSQSFIINDFVKYENSNSGFRQYLRENNLGTELILVLQKKII